MTPTTPTKRENALARIRTKLPDRPSARAKNAAKAVVPPRWATPTPSTEHGNARSLETLEYLSKTLSAFEYRDAQKLISEIRVATAAFEAALFHADRALHKDITDRLNLPLIHAEVMAVLGAIETLAAEHLAKTAAANAAGITAHNEAVHRVIETRAQAQVAADAEADRIEAETGRRPYNSPPFDPHAEDKALSLVARRHAKNGAPALKP
jgi:hypothetical protein